MTIAIGNDRNGIDYKNRIMAHLESIGHTVINCGTDEDFPADYPVYAERVGIGICLAVCKIKGIRAGMGYTDDVARLMRQHNDANVIAFGQDYMTYEEVERRLDIFLATEFIGGYHCSRIQQIKDLEEGKPICQTEIMNKTNLHVKGK